jgi:nicotinate-nucleotide pyrophosphorylase (carboxylating)
MTQLDPPPIEAVRAIVRAALAEDRAGQDVTTHVTVPHGERGSGRFLVKQRGVICGLEVARETFAQLSDDVAFEVLVADGAAVEPGGVVATIAGPLRAILGGERVALNLLQRMSGIATLTHALVERAAAGGTAKITDTRKTTPGLRALERYAVRTGGAYNHRDTLEDGVMIKDNHVEAARRRGASLASVVAQVRERVPHTVRIEIEADTVDLAYEAVHAGADIVLLDNMPPEVMRPIIDAMRHDPDTGHVLFEASGGIRIETIEAVAASGVDLISVGALTHSAQALDISLDVRPL